MQRDISKAKSLGHYPAKGSKTAEFDSYRFPTLRHAFSIFWLIRSKYYDIYPIPFICTQKSHKEKRQNAIIRNYRH